MDVTSSFLITSVNSSSNLTWVFLVDWALAVLAGLGILFYLNRLVGVLLSFVFKRLLWKYLKVRIKIQSIKISFLGGRIFFKNVTIITKNELVLIHQGWFTWRYWLGSVKRSGLDVNDDIDSNKNDKLPSRFLLEVYGLEVFMYNKTAAYDEILETLTKKNEDFTDSKEFDQFMSNMDRTKSTFETSSDNVEAYRSNSSNNAGTITEEDPSLSNYFKFLPIAVSIKKGSLVIGNNRTSSLFVASYSTLKGVVDAEPSANNLDYCRSAYNLRASQLQVFLKPNVSYKTIEQIASEIHETADIYRFNFIRKFFRSFDVNIGRAAKESKLPKEKQEEQKERDDEWHGLERYLTTVTNARYSSDSSDSSRSSFWKDPKSAPIIFEKTDYARYTHIVDSDYVDINYYYDVPGLTPADYIPTESEDGPDIGNGASAPANGLELSLSGAKIYYGPWADKERVYLQEMLFPAICRDSDPYESLEPGTRRQYVGFELFVETLDEATLRVPLREFSKDILYSNVEGKISTGNTGVNRPFGWLDIKLDQGSTVRTNTSYIPTVRDGWNNTLSACLNSPVISSSVNHNLLFKAKTHTINAHIGYPLQWNGETIWTFNQRSTDAELFLVREHVTLFTDLFGDFSSGDPTPYELFRPFFYNANWDFDNYLIYVNLNEKNIVNDPLDFNDNIYLSFKGSHLNLVFDVPFDTIYKKSTTFNFKMTTSFFDLVLDLPPWNTRHNFMKKKELGKCFNFVMNGSYTYFSSIEIDSVDTIKIDCTCDDTTLECYGFVIKYVLILKENYFGEDVHFQTLPEFMESIREEHDQSSSILRQNETDNVFNPTVKLMNETDLLFSFCVTNGCIILPSHIYDCESHLALHFDSLDIDLRFNNYYMDIQADFSTINSRFLDSSDESKIFETTRHKPDFDPELIIDGLSIHGHRMFGLPPTEPTYYCRWEFDAGDINIDAEPKFLDALDRSISALGVGYHDDENSLGIPIEPVTDIVNLTFDTTKIGINLNGPDYYLKVDLNDLSFSLSDQATLNYNSRIDLKIKEIVAKSVKNDITVLEFETSLKFTDFIQKPDFKEKRASQIKHVKVNDGPYHRCPFLLPTEERDSTYYKDYGSIKPSVCLPDVPPPFNADSMDLLISGYPQSLQNALESMNRSECSSLNDINISSNKDYRFSHPDADGLDPKCEYDNLILNFGITKVFCSPLAALVIADIMSKLNNYSVHNVLDTLQVEVLKHLKKKVISKAETIKVKFDSPLISLKIANSNDSLDFVSVEVWKPFLAASFRKSIEGISEDVVKLHVSQFEIAVLKDNKPRFLSVFQKLKVDLNDKPSDTLVKIDQENLSFDFDPKEIHWLTMFRDTLIAPIKDAIEILSNFKDDNRLSRTQLLYAVSVDGLNHSIRHDPSCITKPSYVSKFKSDHVRFEDSWKIITRLRHVVESLPQDWRTHHNALFKATKWEVPDDAQSQVLNIFQNWRRWEFSNITKSYIFNSVFGTNTNQMVSDKMFGCAVNLQYMKFNVFPFEKLLLMKKFEFVFQSAKLTEDLKELACSLTTAEVDDGINIDIKVGSVVSDLGAFKDSVNHLVELLDDLKLLIKEYQTSNNKPSLQDTSSIQIAEAETTDSSVKPMYYSINLLISNFKYHFGIDRLDLDVYGKGNTLSLLGIQSKDLLPFTMYLNSSEINANLLMDNTHLFEYQSQDHTLVVVNSGSIGSGDKLIDAKTRLVKVNTNLGTEKYSRAIDIFSLNEYPIIDPLINAIKGMMDKEDTSIAPALSPISSTPANILSKLKCKVSGSVEFHRFELQLDILSPLSFAMDVQDSKYNFNISKPGIASSFVITRINTSLVTDARERIQYFNTSVDKFKLLLGFTVINDSEYSIPLKIHAEHCRFNLAHHNLVTLLQRGYADYQIISKDIALLKTSVDRLTGVFTRNEIGYQDIGFEASKEITNPKIWEQARMLLQLSLRSFTFVTMLNNNQVILDSSQFGLKVNTYDPTLLEYKPFGQLSMPSTKISFGIHGAQSSRFTVCDLNFYLEVTNFTNADVLLQKLNITSDFCRFVLTPHYTKELIDIAFELERTIDKFDISKNQKREVNKTPQSDTLMTILKFFSINIISRNMCIGWLFPKSRNSAQFLQDTIPGFIIGYENAEFICAKDAGKVLMSGTYVSTARGNTPATYYSTSNESKSDNRFYFPLFELVYTDTDTNMGHNFKAKLLGDKIDVKIQTSVFSVTETLLSSIVSVQEKLDIVHAMYPQKETELNFIPTQTEEDQGQWSLSRAVARSVECILKFDGASIVILNEKLEVNGEVPSFSLQAPTVEISTKYTRCFKGPKKHIIYVEALTSATNNTLLASCVPVIVDLIRSFRIFVNSAQYDRRKSISTQSNFSQRRRQSHQQQTYFELERVFENINVNFSLKIEPQKLTLSCDPTAKIEATVSTNGIHLQFNTDTDQLSGLVYIEDLKAELQHVYSKETSASISIQDIGLCATLAGLNLRKEVSTVGSVTNIDAYLNVQQRQDLDLFRDIWLPGELYEESITDVKKPDTAQAPQAQKTFAAHIRDVSLTTAFPWILTILIGTAKAKVDLGMSLGVLNVGFDGFSAKSTRAVNWDQNVRFEFRKFSIISDGRLGGLLTIEKARMASAFSWKKDQAVLDIPLVLLTAGFSSLETKVSLDYHPFFIVAIKNAMVSIYNQHTESQLDKLVGKTSVESCNVYMTALTASNFVDIYTIGLRIRQDIKISYHQVLKDSAVDQQNATFSAYQETSTSSNAILKSKRLSEEPKGDSLGATATFLDVIEKLRTDLDVRIGYLQLQIFPSSLFDSQALVVKIGSSRAKFLQDVSSKLENKLKLELDDIAVSLSTFKNKPTEKSLEQQNIQPYIKLANTATGGSIFVFPSLKVSMDMWQAPSSNLVEYIYSSSFGGKVDVRWKLGSVYFIREMWYSHATTLRTRLTALRIFTSEYQMEGEDMLEENYKESLFETVNLEDKLKVVESDKKYEYVPLVEPYIETPQLKDLGSATPPLEWFGLHRNKFPNLTHQFVIISLQKLVKEAENRYSKVLK